MKLVVGIDGESYTELSHAFVETEKEAYDWVKEDVKEYNCFEIVKDGDKIYTRYYRSDFNAVLDVVDTPSFHVYQLFDIDESKPFVVVHWHAYDSVDFEISQFDTYRKARCYMSNSVVNIVARNEDSSIEYFDDESSCVDLENEWMMWRIIEIRRKNDQA